MALSFGGRWQLLCLCWSVLVIGVVGVLSPLPFDVHAEPMYVEDVVAVHFCPACADVLVGFVQHSSAHTFCAFYSIAPDFVATLESFNATILTEGHGYTSLMHHKFCTNGTHMLTGSINPSTRGLATSLNDIIIVDNDVIAEYFLREWQWLSTGRLPPAPRLSSRGIDVCLSPRGQCIDTMVETILSAQHDIVVGAFSLTHPRIEQALLWQHHRNISVTVFVDGPQCHSYCLADGLEREGVSVYRVREEGIFHHKILVIDDTVITGSMNPTKNGNHRNAENFIRFTHPDIAQQYRVYLLSFA